MKSTTKQSLKRAVSVILVGTFFIAGCATSSYNPRQSNLIKIMPKGYERDDQFFKRGALNGGLVKATEPNEDALRYAKRSSKNYKWAFGVLSAGVISWLAGAFTVNVGKPASSQRTIVGYSLSFTGLAAVLASLFPMMAGRALESDAINKYNDDILDNGNYKK